MNPETIRQAAHVLLDAISAFDDLNNPDPDPAIRLAFKRLVDIDAVTSTYDDETNTRHLNIHPVLLAATSLVVSSIVDHMGDTPTLDSMTAIGRLRAAMDAAFGTDAQD